MRLNQRLDRTAGWIEPAIRLNQRFDRTVGCVLRTLHERSHDPVDRNMPQQCQGASQLAGCLLALQSIGPPSIAKSSLEHRSMKFNYFTAAHAWAGTKQPNSKHTAGSDWPACGNKKQRERSGMGRIPAGRPPWRACGLAGYVARLACRRGGGGGSGPCTSGPTTQSRCTSSSLQVWYHL